MYNNVQHSLKCTTNVQHFRPVVHHISTAGLPPYRPTGSPPEHIASIQSQGQQRASEIVDFTWRVSDCEELVGVTHRRWWRATARSSFVWSGYCLSLSDRN